MSRSGFWLIIQLSRLLINVFNCVVADNCCAEFLFQNPRYVHWQLHRHRSLYKHVHAIHHEYKDISIKCDGFLLGLPYKYCVGLLEHACAYRLRRSETFNLAFYLKQQYNTLCLAKSPKKIQQAMRPEEPFATVGPYLSPAEFHTTFMFAVLGRDYILVGK